MEERLILTESGTAISIKYTPQHIILSILNVAVVMEKCGESIDYVNNLVNDL
jgi:hypothetical protein